MKALFKHVAQTLAGSSASKTKGGLHGVVARFDVIVDLRLPNNAAKDGGAQPIPGGCSC